MARRLKLYDTMSREVRAVEPEDGKAVKFYCCGPTVYGPAHIGNFRTFVLQDVARRVMEMNGTGVKHVRNVTDVDDKTIRQSQVEKKSLRVFTDHWLDLFRKDCAALNTLPPHVEPGAVDHIPQQIQLVQRLVEKDHAYRSDDGSVYFRVESFPAYGRLSRLQEREITTTTPATSGPVDADEYQRESMADFAVWKARKNEDGENFWESPWGQGRPGWHLECSCMSMEYLGETFDLHGGGVDLVFPHHENEIAQAEAATGRPFARHWFHGTHLLVEGKKMSKSEGNLFTLADLEAKGSSAMEVRYVLISARYSKPLNFTMDSLTVARQALADLFRFKERLELVSGKPEALTYEKALQAGSVGSDPFAKAWDALLEDLNTPEALGQIFISVKDLDGKVRVGAMPQAEAQQALLSFERILLGLGLVLSAREVEEAPAEIMALAQKRWDAKKAKDWSTADVVRDELAAKGWVMQDGKDGFKVVAK